MLEKFKFWNKAKSEEVPNINDEVFPITFGTFFENINSNSSLNEITYYVCLKILSEALGKLTIHLYDKNNERVINHKLYDVFNIRPNEFMTPSTFKQVVEYNRNHFGNSYIYIERKGKNINLFPLKTQDVRVIINDDATSKIPKIIYEINGKGKNIYLRADEIIHLKGGLSNDGLMGKSVRETLVSSFSAARESDQVLLKAWQRGLSAKGVITTAQDLNKENREKLLKIIAESLSNKGNKDLVVLPYGATLTPANEKMADSQFLELKLFTANQIASAFGISPIYLNDYTKSSYSNSESQNLSFYVDTMLAILKQYEEEFNYKLLTENERRQGLQFKFNVAGILRGDLKSQAEAIRSLVGAGVYTINEARSMLDKPKLDEGDTPIVNGSYVKLKDIGIAYNKGGGNGNDKDT